MKNLRKVFLMIVMIVVIYGRAEAEDDVVLFVIDSASSIFAEDQKLFGQFNKFSHEEAVSKLARIRARRAFNIDDSKGNISKDNYFIALYYILEQTRKLEKGKRIVINMSFGNSMPIKGEHFLIKQLYKNDVIMVAAAGNDGIKACKYPAAYDEVIAVGACEDFSIALYSNDCKDIDIFANGKYVETRTRDFFLERSTEELTLHGTSFSTPRVAGIVVRMLKEAPGLKKDEIVDILQRTSTKLSGSRSKGGRVDGLKALAEVSDDYEALYNLRELIITLSIALSGLLLGGILLYFLYLLLPAFLYHVFRLFLPWLWFYLRKREIKKIMIKKQQNDKDIRVIIKCLVAQDDYLEEIAAEALLAIYNKSAYYHQHVYNMLYSALNRAKRSEFVDEKAPINRFLLSIGGSCLQTPKQ